MPAGGCARSRHTAEGAELHRAPPAPSPPLLLLGLSAFPGLASCPAAVPAAGLSACRTRRNASARRLPAGEPGLLPSPHGRAEASARPGCPLPPACEAVAGSGLQPPARPRRGGAGPGLGPGPGPRCGRKFADRAAVRSHAGAGPRLAVVNGRLGRGERGKKKRKKEKLLSTVELYPRENELSQEKHEFLLYPCGNSSSFTAH